MPLDLSEVQCRTERMTPRIIIEVYTLLYQKRKLFVIYKSVNLCEVKLKFCFSYQKIDYIKGKEFRLFKFLKCSYEILEKFPLNSSTRIVKKLLFLSVSPQCFFVQPLRRIVLVKSSYNVTSKTKEVDELFLMILS